VNVMGADAEGHELPASVLDAQVEAMSQRVSQDRDSRCAQLRAAAESQVHEILRSARSEARANVHAAVVRERKLGDQALRQARASALLEERQRAQQETRALLRQMWAAIAGVLESRWDDPAQRKTWVQTSIRQAKSLLIGRSWRIEHGASWSQEQLAELGQLISGKAESGSAYEVTLACDRAIRGGIRIGTVGACLDTTIAGLLASRAEIESEFLAQYLAVAKPHE